MSIRRNWSSIEEIPTRLDLEEEEIIEIDEDEDKDYEPPEPIYQSD